MDACLLYVLWQGKGKALLTCRELPPMTIPQMLLPDEARFCGVGQIDGRDAYLFAAKGKGSDGEPVTDPALCALLEKLARSAEPQDFALRCENGSWQMESRALEEEQYT